ncbi:unnamed protein product, partial [Prorocentrum cordatum]
MGDGAVMECCFNPHEAWKKAQAKFNGRCMWCSPVRLETVCKDARQSKLAARFLVILNDLDKGIFDVAAERLAAHENGGDVVDRANAILAERGGLADGAAEPAAPLEERPPDDEDAPELPPQPAPLPPAPAQDPRPTSQQRRAHRLCEGYALARAMGRQLRGKQDCGTCVFSTAAPGNRARALGGQCVFCTPDRMKEAARDTMKKQNVVAASKKFEKEKPAVEGQKPAVYEKALGRLRRHLTVGEFKDIVTPRNCCRGAGADMCLFNTKSPGAPAFVKKDDKGLCSWCNPERLRDMQTSRAGGVLAQLQAFRQQDAAVAANAEAIAKEILGDDYMAKLQQKRARAHQQRARHLRRKGDQKKQWAEALKKRKLPRESPHDDRETRKRYRAGVLADQKKDMNSFFPDEADRRARGVADDVPKPEDALPPLKDATHSDLSAGLRSWLERGSWGKCVKCGCLQPRPMHEIDLAGDPKVEVRESQCRRCNAARDYWAPTPDDVPRALRNLSDDIAQALRPIEVDVGPETRSTDSLGRWNGYRKKVKMIAFYFSKWHVEDKIQELEGKQARNTARKAHRYLLSCEESAYRRFHDMHENLYWRTDMTETHEQWSDARREENREAKDPKKKRAKYGYDSDDSDAADGHGKCDADELEQGDDGGQRTSVKRSFMAKCLSDLIGYQSDFELLQFVFDLNLWATLGAKKNLNLENVPMRIRMKGHPFSPLYWKDTLNALVDLVRQVGLPKLFFTIAPWEQSFPYHEWLRDEMHKTLRTRMHLPVGEIVRGVIAGNNQQSQDRADRRWKKHVFSCKTEDGKTTKTVTSFTRLEFQDGSRKEGTKRYDGSGRPHLHVLFFAEEDVLADAKLERHLFASKTDEFSDHLKGYIDGSQLDKRGASESKWPVYSGEPGYHIQAEKLLLQHSQADKEAGLRAFCVDVMDAVPIHQDWLESDGESLLLQYVTKYVAKFSDSSYDEWMNGQASADSVARRVCFEYHPYEPEMILQLCGAQFRQVDISAVSGGWRSVTAPYVGMAETPAWVEKYATCEWRSEEMCLLEWLRKTNDDGRIAGWLKARHKAALYEAAYQHHCATLTPGGEPPSPAGFRSDLRKQYKQSGEGAPFLVWMEEMSVRAGASAAEFPSLEEFARDYVVRGEKIVAVDTVFEFNDRYYGQWAAMNVPFRDLEDLRFDVVDKFVPAKFRHLAAALKLCANRSRVPEEFRELFVDESSQKFSESVYRMIVGQRKLIDMYLTGVLDKNDERTARDAEAAATGGGRQARDGAQADVTFLRKQLHVEETVNESVDRALQANHSENWEEADEAREEAFQKNKPIVCLGKPGTGKTTVVKCCIRRAQERGARVLFALPTAQLSSRMKQALPLMTMYDLVVVDEVSLLDCPQFERLIKLWSVAEKVPALVFLGDKCQLPGVGETRPWESAAWPRPNCYHVKLDETRRCKEERFQHILDELRTSKPSKETLQNICRGHKAWKIGAPTPADLKTLFEKHPETRIVTCTRKGAATVNEAAIVALCGRKSPLGTLPGDVELNPENYWDGKFRTDRRPIPSAVPVYKKMQVYLTKNVRKEDDYVNGMLCEVENYHADE